MMYSNEIEIEMMGKEMDGKELIFACLNADLEFADIYDITIPPGSKTEYGTTVPGMCGIVLPYKGKAVFELEGESYELEPGMILHAGAGMRLRKEAVGKSEWRFILIHYRVRGNCKAKEYLENFNYRLETGIIRNHEINSMIPGLLSCFHENTLQGNLQCRTILYQIIQEITKLINENLLATKGEQIEYITEYIQGNLEKDLSIAQLAEMFGMDARQLHYQFFKKMNLSPKRYISECRIRQAKKLLEKDHFSVSQVAEMVGYEDALHFSRFFKKNTGLSPSHYRRNFEKNPWRI